MSNDILAPLDPNCGIYQFLAPSSNCYIGQSRNLKRRISEHWRLLKLGSHPNGLLQRAFGKHGVALVAQVVEVCPVHQLNSREQYWMDNTTCKYNYSKDAFNNMNDPVVKALHSAAMRSAAHRHKMSAISKVFACTDAFRLNGSIKMKARWQDPDYYARVTARQRVVASTDEARANNRAVQLIAQNKPEQLAKTSAFQNEYQNRPEVKAVRSAFMRVHANKPETKMNRAQKLKVTRLAKRIRRATEFGLIGLSAQELRVIRQIGRKPSASQWELDRATVARNLLAFPLA